MPRRLLPHLVRIVLLALCAFALMGADVAPGGDDGCGGCGGQAGGPRDRGAAADPATVSQAQRWIASL